MTTTTATTVTTVTTVRTAAGVAVTADVPPPEPVPDPAPAGPLLPVAGYLRPPGSWRTRHGRQFHHDGVTVRIGRRRFADGAPAVYLGIGSPVRVWIREQEAWALWHLLGQLLPAAGPAPAWLPDPAQPAAADCFIEACAVQIRCSVCGFVADDGEEPLMFASRAEAVEFVAGYPHRAWRVTGEHAVCGQCAAEQACHELGHDWTPWWTPPAAAVAAGAPERSRDCRRCWHTEQADRTDHAADTGGTGGTGP